MKRKKLLILFALVSMFIYIPEVDAMQIFVKKINAENIILEVNSSDTIEVVKDKIYQVDNSFLPENQKLVFAAKTLENGRTLADYGIQQDSTIYLFPLINNGNVKVSFDANGGTFVNSTVYVIDKWYPELYDTLKVPTKEGYKFKGYYTEKIGGTKFEMILNEAGIDNNSIFYAQWEKKENVEEIINPNTEYDGDNLILILIVSFGGLLSVLSIYEKKIKL